MVWGRGAESSIGKDLMEFPRVYVRVPLDSLWDEFNKKACDGISQSFLLKEPMEDTALFWIGAISPGKVGG